MTKCKNTLINCAFYLIFAILVAAPALADYTPPGRGGGDILTLGESAANNVFIEAPAGITNWVMIPGTNSRVGILKVGANGNWQVTANDTGSTNGHMTEHDGNSYVGNPNKQLTSPMNISVESGGNVSNGYEVQLPGGGMIAKGGSTNGTSTTKNVEVTFKQPVSWGDSVLTDGHKYQIVVTFTISPYS